MNRRKAEQGQIWKERIMKWDKTEKEESENGDSNQEIWKMDNYEQEKL